MIPPSSSRQSPADDPAHAGERGDPYQLHHAKGHDLNCVPSYERNELLIKPRTKPCDVIPRDLQESDTGCSHDHFGIVGSGIFKPRYVPALNPKRPISVVLNVAMARFS
jgi:hypothetical protein